MGGAIMVGIRRSDGREQCSIRWTNAMPNWLADTSFQDEGSALEEFWNRGKSRAQLKDRLDYDLVVPYIARSEYGLILIDFERRMVLSRNGYASPCALNVATFNTSFLNEQVPLVLALRAAGRIRALYAASYEDERKRFSKQQTERYFSELERLASDRERAIRSLGARSVLHSDFTLVCIAYSFPLGWLIFNGDGPPRRQAWTRVKEWVRDYGWQTPVRDRPV